jgi:hypothetical protein
VPGLADGMCIQRLTDIIEMAALVKARSICVVQHLSSSRKLDNIWPFVAPSDTRMVKKRLGDSGNNLSGSWEARCR